MRRVMLIGYTMETLRAEAPLHAASTPAVEAVLAAGRRSRDSGGTATMLVNPMRPWHVPHDSDCSKPHPFALNGDQVKGAPKAGQVSKPRPMGGEALLDSGACPGLDPGFAGMTK
jgi:hypothetical protein